LDRLFGVYHMARTRYIEMRDGERWADGAEAFMRWRLHAKKVAGGGCHEGDAVASADGRRYAAISIPDHSPDLLIYLREWAVWEGRTVR
jgi:hypothetical protein